MDLTVFVIALVCNEFLSYSSLLAGLSLKSQELTAIFLAVRLYCSFVMEHDIHTLLDTATLVTTLWVIYMIRFKLRSSYMDDKDNFPIYYVVSSLHTFLGFNSWTSAFCTFQIRTKKYGIFFMVIEFKPTVGLALTFYLILFELFWNLVWEICSAI